MTDTEVGAAATSPRGERNISGGYWRRRMDMLYYQYFDYIMRTVARDAGSLIDVGSGNCPYLEWFDWIPSRLSIDINKPYTSDAVRGLRGDILETDFGRVFDVCTCLQVLEHIPDPAPFAKRLFELAPLVIISVPFKWPEGKTRSHLHDPVDEAKLASWTERKANYRIVVREPFSGKKGQRLIAVYNSDSTVHYTNADAKRRIPRDPALRNSS